MDYIASIINELKRTIKGEETNIKIVLSAFLADGHVLLEGPPGTGKTTLAIAFSRVLGLRYRRIQFTSDLLPSDILGTYIYNQHSHKFEFSRGPIFNNLILADEINRASPKTQSALLEAMEEKQVTIEGNTFKLPAPFFVIATQNPLDYSGTFPLPITQLDRFMVRLKIDFPNKKAEKEILIEDDPREIAKSLPSVVNPDILLNIQKEIKSVHIDESLIEYILEIASRTRIHPQIKEGLSPRASLHLMRISKSFAYVNKRKFVIPDDIRTLFVPVASHRILCDIPSCDLKVFLEELILEIPFPK